MSNDDDNGDDDDERAVGENPSVRENSSAHKYAYLRAPVRSRAYRARPPFRRATPHLSLYIYIYVYIVYLCMCIRGKDICKKTFYFVVRRARNKVSAVIYHPNTFIKTDKSL